MNNRNAHIYTPDQVKGITAPVFARYDKKVVFAYLFGSAANPDPSYPPKDIDIAVYFNSGGIDAELDLFRDICRALKTDKVDMVALNKAKNLILQDEIVRHAIVLYDGNTDLRQDFELKVLHQAIDFRQQRAAL